MLSRKIKWTVLAVGEGDAEVALLEHLKGVYFSRDCGAKMKIQQAHGKGAQNVVRRAISYGAAEYDRCLVLFDTDTDYTTEVIQLAEEHRLTTMPSQPCLEGMLLRLMGDVRVRLSDQHKQEFERRFGGRVQDPHVLANHFGLDVIERLRDECSSLHRLVNTFGIPRKLSRRDS